MEYLKKGTSGHGGRGFYVGKTGSAPMSGPCPTMAGAQRAAERPVTTGRKRKGQRSQAKKKHNEWLRRQESRS